MRIPLLRQPLNKISLLALAVLTACSFQKEKAEENAGGNLVSKETEMAQLLEGGIQQIPNWQAHWRSIDKSFDPGAFQVYKELEYDDLEWPEENPIQSDSPFFPHLVHHPEGGGAVDIFSYKVVIPVEGTPGFEPDSEVIYFKSNGMRERLLFIGPSGGFQEAVWVSSDYLMVAGFFEEEDGFAPVLWLINVNDRNYTLYSNPTRVSRYPFTQYLEKKLKNISFPKDGAESGR